MSGFRMIGTVLSLAAGITGCTAHVPLRTKLGAHHPTQSLSFRATSEEQEIADITAPVEDDDWCDIKIVVTYPLEYPLEYPIESIPRVIELRIRDSAGVPIEGNVDVTCGQGGAYSGGKTDRPGCMLVSDVKIDETSPMQPIRLFVRSIAGRDTPIVVTLTYGLGDKIRVREGPRLAPQ
jgi:hypothetical protein